MGGKRGEGEERRERVWEKGAGGGGKFGFFFF